MARTAGVADTGDTFQRETAPGVGLDRRVLAQPHFYHLRASAQTRQIARDKLGAVEAMKLLPPRRERSTRCARQIEIRNISGSTPWKKPGHFLKKHGSPNKQEQKQ